MPISTDIKRALLGAGLEVYRTRGDAVHLAERVRENLIMDAGIAIDGDPPKVVFVVRAQRSDFPGEDHPSLFARARALATAAIARGFQEVGCKVRDVPDPGDAARTLDSWCEVQFEKSVADLDAAVVEARFLLAFEKAASL